MRLISDPEDMQQLIADCADIPHSLNAQPAVIMPRPAPDWEVDDATHAQVHDLDEYV